MASRFAVGGLSVRKGLNIASTSSSPSGELPTLPSPNSQSSNLLRLRVEYGDEVLLSEILKEDPSVGSRQSPLRRRARILIDHHPLAIGVRSQLGDESVVPIAVSRPAHEIYPPIKIVLGKIVRLLGDVVARDHPRRISCPITKGRDDSWVVVHD